MFFKLNTEFFRDLATRNCMLADDLTLKISGCEGQAWRYPVSSIVL